MFSRGFFSLVSGRSPTTMKPTPLTPGTRAAESGAASAPAPAPASPPPMPRRRLVRWVDAQEFRRRGLLDDERVTISLEEDIRKDRERVSKKKRAEKKAAWSAPKVQLTALTQQEILALCDDGVDYHLPAPVVHKALRVRVHAKAKKDEGYEEGGGEPTKQKKKTVVFRARGQPARRSNPVDIPGRRIVQKRLESGSHKKMLGNIDDKYITKYSYIDRVIEDEEAYRGQPISEQREADKLQARDLQRPDSGYGDGAGDDAVKGLL